MKKDVLRLLTILTTVIFLSMNSISIYAQDNNDELLIREVASGQIKGNLDNENNVLEC